MKKIMIIALVGSMLLSGCGAGDSESTATKEKAKGAQEEQVIFLAAGKVEAQSELSVSSKLTARVAKVNVDLGSKVKKGDPLVVLDITDINAGVKKEEAAVNSAQANLAKGLRGARGEQVAQAKAGLDGARTNYDNAKHNLERMRQLLAAGGATAQQVENAQSAFATAEAAFKSGQEQYNLLTSGETKESINILQAQVNQARAGLEAARAQQNNGVITAPVSGTVSGRSIDSGELATTGAALLSIVSDDGTFINAQAPTDILSYLKVGMPVVVKVREYPEKDFAGEITVISPVVDQKTKTIQVKVQLNKSATELKTGMIAEIGIKHKGEDK